MLQKSLQNRSNKVRRLYNWLSPFYKTIHVLLLPGNARLEAQVGALPAGRLLEIGVGTGLRLALFRGHRVTGIDLSPKMLQRARRQAPEATLLQMEGERTDFPDEAFDTVVLAHVLSVTPNPNVMLEEAFRLLKAGGTLIIQNYFAPFTVGGWIAERSRFLHLRAGFSLSALPQLALFQKVYEEQFGFLGFFSLLVFEKCP